ncbi:hypothetical protein AAMO2058_000363100 [Amorphochlora amoebiformis]
MRRPGLLLETGESKRKQTTITIEKLEVKPSLHIRVGKKSSNVSIPTIPIRSKPSLRIDTSDAKIHRSPPGSSPRRGFRPHVYRHATPPTPGSYASSGSTLLTMSVRYLGSHNQSQPQIQTQSQPQIQTQSPTQIQIQPTTIPGIEAPYSPEETGAQYEYPPSPRDELSSEAFIPLGKIGRGQNGAVTMALHIPTLRIMALKKLNIYKLNSRRQLMEELRTFSRCKHECIIELGGAFFDQGKIVLALEYMNAGSLSQWIETHGALTERVASSVLVQALKGLKKLHDSKYIHGDIKPENILVNFAGEAKITDFGLAREVLTTKGIKSAGGTLLYLSPERLSAKRFSFPSDMWSVGITIRKLLTLSVGFTSTEYWGLVDEIVGGDPPTLDPNKFSKAVCEASAACLHKDPNVRDTVDDLLARGFFRYDTPIPISRWFRGEDEKAGLKRSEKAIDLIENVFRKFREMDLEREIGPYLCQSLTIEDLQTIVTQLGGSVEETEGKVTSILREQAHFAKTQLGEPEVISGDEGEDNLNPHEQSAIDFTQPMGILPLPPVSTRNIENREDTNNGTVPEWARKPTRAAEDSVTQWPSWANLMRVYLPEKL